MQTTDYPLFDEVKRACMFSDVSCLCGSDIKAEIDEIVWQMSRDSQIVPLKIKEMEYLYDESVIVKRRFYSCAKDGEERMESVVREMKKYEPADKKSFERVLILIQTSKKLGSVPGDSLFASFLL